MRRLFVWGTLKSDGCNHPFFLKNAKLVQLNFVFEEASLSYMKFGEIYEVNKEEFESIDRFEVGFGYKQYYNQRYNIYYYVGTNVKSDGRFIL